LPFVETIALKELTKDDYGKIRLFGSIGFILIVLIVPKYDFNTNLIISYLLVLSILTAFISYSISKFDQIKIAKHQKFSIGKNYELWISLFLMQLSFGAYYNFFTIYETKHGISLTNTGYLWSVGVVAEIIMLYFQGIILKKYSLITLIKISTLLTAFRWLGTYYFASNIIALYFIQTIHAFSFALYHTSVIMFLFVVYQQQKLAQQFFLGIAYGLGGALGALIAGWLYGEYLFVYFALIAFLAYLFLIKLKI
jgi:PPP family 3-phenylpropionic acid transporter